MVIYLDIILIENLIMNYIILITTGIINKMKLKYVRILIASLLGAIYSVITYIKLGFLQNNLFANIILSIVMIMIAFNLKKIKKIIRVLIIFYLTTFVFGGTTLYLLNVLNIKECAQIRMISVAVLGRNNRISYSIYVFQNG